MASAAKATEKGDNMVEKADKKLTSWTMPWNTERVQEEAAELLVSASGQYKIAKDWNKAGETYVKAAQLFEQLKDEFSACTNYNNAAKAFKNSSAKEAVKNLKLACELHRDGGRFSSAGKLFKEIAIIEEKEMNTKGAIEAYNEAADCFQAEDATVTMNSMLLKVAELSAQGGEYKKAVEIYEKVANTSIDNRMQSYAVKDYLFKAGLCNFVIVAKTGDTDDIKDVEEAMNKYKDMFPAFDGSREAKLLDNCIEAFQKDDCEKFTDYVYKYDQISKLNDWTASLLLEIKNVLKHGVAVDPSGEGEDDDGLDIR